jgi:hypothetical protein
MPLSKWSSQMIILVLLSTMIWKTRKPFVLVCLFDWTIMKHDIFIKYYKIQQNIENIGKHSKKFESCAKCIITNANQWLLNLCTFERKIRI